MISDQFKLAHRLHRISQAEQTQDQPGMAILNEDAYLYSYLVAMGQIIQIAGHLNSVDAIREAIDHACSIVQTPYPI